MCFPCGGEGSWAASLPCGRGGVTASGEHTQGPAFPSVQRGTASRTFPGLRVYLQFSAEERQGLGLWLPFSAGFLLVYPVSTHICCCRGQCRIQLSAKPSCLSSAWELGISQTRVGKADNSALCCLHAVCHPDGKTRVPEGLGETLQRKLRYPGRGDASAALSCAL